MLNAKKLISKILKQQQAMQEPLFAIKTGVSVPSTTWTQICKITLPAGGKYLLFGYGITGASSNSTSVYIGLNKISGDHVAEKIFLGSAIGQTIGSGSKSFNGYIETETACEIEVRMYMYGPGSTSTANAWIVAVPIRMGGVARRLLNTLQSLAFRKAVIVC